MNIKVEKEFDDLPVILGDSAQLRKAFFVILYNAMQAVKGVQKRIVTIKGSVDSDKKMISIVFSDSGESIDAERMNRIFDPLYLAENEPGQRLGFSVVKEIISEHGGKIDVKLIPGTGNVVMLSLPVR
jgi:nitrogen fixation/metabolism regulation signal transduction histidine kinase